MTTHFSYRALKNMLQTVKMIIFPCFSSVDRTETWSSGLGISCSHLYIQHWVLFLAETTHISEYSVIFYVVKCFFSHSLCFSDKL